MDVHIQHATSADPDEVAALFDQYRIFYGRSSDPAGARAFMGARLQGGDSVVLLARGPRGPASGFVQLYPSFSSLSMQRVWNLNDLYVRVECRRQGIASALLQHAEAFARADGAKGLILCTQHTNTQAQALYRQHHYEPIDDYGWYFLAT